MTIKFNRTFSVMLVAPIQTDSGPDLDHCHKIISSFFKFVVEEFIVSCHRFYITYTREQIA